MGRSGMVIVFPRDGELEYQTCDLLVSVSTQFEQFYEWKHLDQVFINTEHHIFIKMFSVNEN